MESVLNRPSESENAEDPATRSEATPASPGTNRHQWRWAMYRVVGACILLGIINRRLAPIENGLEGGPIEWFIVNSFSWAFIFSCVFVPMFICVKSLMMKTIEQRVRRLSVSLDIATLTALVILGIGTYAAWHSRNSAGSAMEVPGISSAEAATPDAQATVIVLEQDALGLTSNDLNAEWLRAAETWMVKTMFERSKESYAAMGRNPEDMLADTVRGISTPTVFGRFSVSEALDKLLE